MKNVKQTAMAAGMMLALMTAQVALADTVTVPVPDMPVQGAAGPDVATTVTKLFGSITKYALIASGSVLALVLVVIGFRFVTGTDSKHRAETMDWLKWALIGSGFIFGGTVIARLIVYVFSQAV